tara:strand:- start:371 stop:1102 length:732 start_codon:yes stop_codon:yes gene_type:complete
MGAPFTPTPTKTDKTKVVNPEDFLVDDWTEDKEPVFEAAPTSWTEYVHTTLSTAGIVHPGADAIDGLLYLLEGELGSAGLSFASIIPGFGEMRKAKKTVDAFADGRKVLKEAEDAGEEIISVYRGVGEWHSGKMTSGGKYVSGKGPGTRLGDIDDHAVYTSLDFDAAKGYTMRKVSGEGRKQIYNVPETAKILEFKIPKSYIESHGLSQLGTPSWKAMENYRNIAFPGGIPKGFLHKVHKDVK